MANVKIEPTDDRRPTTDDRRPAAQRTENREPTDDRRLREPRTGYQR
jgi:hypothetical protein